MANDTFTPADFFRLGNEAAAHASSLKIAEMEARSALNKRARRKSVG